MGGQVYSGVYRISSDDRRRAPQVLSIVLMVMVLASIAGLVQITKQSYAGPQLSNKFEGGKIYVLRASLDKSGSLIVLVSNNEDHPISIVYAYVMDSHGRIVSSAHTYSEDGYTIPPHEMRFVYLEIEKPLKTGDYLVQVVSQGMGSGFTGLHVGG